MTRRGLTDDEATLLLAGQAPREDDADVATFLRATRELYLRDPRTAVGERHEAMIAAAARSQSGADVASVKRSRLRPRRVAALAAPALAFALAGAFFVFDGAEREPTPTVSDRPSPDRTRERTDLPERRPAEPEPGRRSRPAPERQTPSTPSVAPVTPSAEPATPGLRATEEPAPHAQLPAEAKPPPKQGYGGPDQKPEPLKGPLDTEPPIDSSPDGSAPPDGEPAIEPDPEPPIDSPLEGSAPPDGEAPIEPDPAPEP